MRIWRNRGAPPAEFGEADQVIRCSCNLAESTISQVDQHLTTSSSSTVGQGGVGHGCWARPRPRPGVHLLGDAGCGEEVRRAARSAAAGRCRMRRGGETRGQERDCWARRGAGTSAWTRGRAPGRRWRARAEHRRRGRAPGRAPNALDAGSSARTTRGRRSIGNLNKGEVCRKFWYFNLSQMQISWSSMILELILGLLWYLVHLLISLFDLWSHLSNILECYLISSELLPKYRNLHFERLNYLGVVVDRREANNVLKIKQLLRWLSTIGVKYVVLYDIEGVLKKLLEPGMETPRDEKSITYLHLGAHGVIAIVCFWF